MSDNYPVLVASANLPSIQEQAVQLKAYLADDANVFGAEWLGEQQRRLEAVYSYVKDRAIKVEVSHCQRLIELRIGEWLGPAKGREETGRGKSSPGDEIHNRHKHEFRFLAEHKDIVMDIMKNHPGKEITRAGLIAAIEDALLINHGALAGSERKVSGQYLCPCGESFDRIVWHCEVCAYHWPLEREACGNCHQGKRPEQKPLHDLEGIDVEDFKLATRTLGIVAEFREFTLSANPARVLAGLKDYEKSALFANPRVIGDWIDSVEQIKEKDRQDVPPELP